MTIRLPFASLLAALLLAALATPASAAPKLSNRTMMTYDPGHGTQVEYFDGSGRNYLWYPGNTGVVPGRWKLEGGNLCFRYGANTYNPQTNQSGGNWECQPTDIYEFDIVDQAGGDVFGLSSGAIPFVLTPGRTTIATLAKGEAAAAAAPSVSPGAANCEQILAQETESAFAMVQAGWAYFRGSCGKIDYVRAFELFRMGGHDGAIRVARKELEDRAATGNPRAIAALEAIGD